MSASAPPAPEPLTVTPLVEELVPCPDPWEVARKLAHLPHLLFLDSAEQHPERGRYSYVTADVGLQHHIPARGYPPKNSLWVLEEDWREHRTVTIPGLPPFQGGIAGLFGYELGRAFERRVPEPQLDEFLCPEWATGLYDWVFSFDHVELRSWLLSTGYRSRTGQDPREAAKERIRQVKRILDGPVLPPRTTVRSWPSPQPVPPDRIGRQYSLPGFPGVTSNFSREGYLAAVRRAIEYTHAGDCFQVNMSQRLLTPLTEHPLELYGRLRKTNPAPFACYFDAGEFQIVSASPERFLKVSPGGVVVTQPIKGTRPRGRTPEEDSANVRDLVASPKDRAENVMIVDLLRNDLGRVCEYGSVTVPKVCEVETYRYVHHLVSEVRGKLRPGMTPFDLLRAAFPGGSVTGAPKVRAMEIIAELEPTARGLYCGSVGFVGFDGSMDTNILIRTFTAGRGWLQFPVGGGVVADSDPEREYEETLHKAAGLLRALK
jgi:para-aminobenzoate synthetase component 1